ncbi:MAG TPA: response regulator [Spirochaetota bacterium]|jgi:DNA-binding response OmpR family regulator|nr:MAG: Chemotaxis protein CheY [Spirochaetes bacterium ADurb.Bin133]HNZ26387.1 response regulator [Spirochaetota bacterium]HPY86762.1 response regulator [Spirochaetota bacterium]
MASDEILIIDRSNFVKDFLKEKFLQSGFDVLTSNDCFDGLIKMKNHFPDVVILDYVTLKYADINFLKEKQDYKAIRDIPIILLANKINTNTVYQLAKYNITKIFSKPIKFGDIMRSISELLNKTVIIDETPCQLDVTINYDTLFIDIARGLNGDRIDSLKYKIRELMNIHRIDQLKTLLIMVDMNLSYNNDYRKFHNLIHIILDTAKTEPKFLKILTKSKEVKDFLKLNSAFKDIEVTDNIESTLEKLNINNINDYIVPASKTGKEDVFLWTNEISEKGAYGIDEIEKIVKIAVVDDDEYILDFIKEVLALTGYKIYTYSKAGDFLENVKKEKFDLIFLDLMMPKISGFDALQTLNKSGNKIPVIIFSALSQRETVQRALSLGVKSYLVKPVDSSVILKKVAEVLNANI